MNGAHDVGGMHGFGPVHPAQSEPVFDEDWERRVFALMMAVECHGKVTIDAARHTIERLGNATYLNTSYYEQWVMALEKILVENDVATEAELRDRTEQVRDDPSFFTPPANEGPDEMSAMFAEIVANGAPSLREAAADPEFQIGDAIRTRVMSPAGHTRLPRYARGKRGTIVAYHGAHVLPDANAHGAGECPEPLYGVRFAANELWGESGVSGDCVHLDLWQSYLTSDATEGAT